MPYAIKGDSWRAIKDKNDIQDGETFSLVAPPPSEPEEGEQEIFAKPIVTPAVYADDIFVSSRNIKDDPDEAFAEALAETGKTKGEPKSLDLIARSTLKAVQNERKKIKALEATIKELDDRLKKLKV